MTGNVISYTNDCDTFNTTQEYQYDVLGQLIEVNGKSICNKYSSGPEYVADYTQTWKFDNIGRVEKKTSNAVCPLKNDLGGDLLSYSFDYTYIEGKANQVGSCTGRYYAYDANGNMTIEQNVPIETETTGYIATVTQVKDDAYYVDQAWGVENDKQTAVSGISRRIFEYNCKNEMIVSKDSNYYTKYIYNQEGQRTSKYSSLGESLYFNEYASWTKRSGDSGNPDGRDAMHIYINGQRIVTKQNSATRYELSDQINKQYWYHTNHIGNVDVITERDGNQFERFEYTPYGETWIHHDSLYLNNSNLGIFGDSIDIKYRFTGKEKDEETGYTYFGARYLDSKRGIWTQTDPALGDYIPTAGTTPDKLPGMGGIYNLVNSQLYHYAGNNPVKYTDPDGEFLKSSTISVTERAIPWKDVSELRDKLSTKQNRFDNVHDFVSWGMTVLSIFCPQSAAVSLISTADGLLSVHPDSIDKAAVNDLQELCNYITDLGQTTGSLPDVQVTEVTTKVATNEDSYGSSAAPFARPVMERSITTTKELKITINGEVWKDKNGKEKTIVISTERQFCGWVNSVDYNNFEWAE